MSSSSRRDEADPRVIIGMQAGFGGGEDEVTAPRMLSQYTCQSITNGYVTRAGDVTKRGGFPAVTLALDGSGNDTSGNAWQFLASAINDTNTDRIHLVGMCNGKLYSINTDNGTYKHIASGYATAASKPTPAVEVWNNKVYFSDGTNGLVSITVTDASGNCTVAADYSGNFNALCKRQASEVMFGIDTTDPSNMRWCATFNAASWTGSDVVSPSGRFIGMAELGDVFVALQEDMLYRIDGTDPTTWQLRPVPSDGLGLTGAHALKSVQGAVVFLDDDAGWCTFNGSLTRPISVKTETPTASQTTYARIIEAYPFLYLFYSSDGSYMDRCAVVDFERSAWANAWVLPNNPTCAALHKGTLYLGCSDGRILKYDTSTFTDVDDADVSLTIRTKSWDSARPTMDKVANSVRLAYSQGASDASGNTNPVSVAIYREGDAAGVSAALTLSPHDTGHTAVSKAHQEFRIQNVRGCEFFIEVTDSNPRSFTLHAVEFDHFFAPRRL